MEEDFACVLPPGNASPFGSFPFCFAWGLGNELFVCSTLPTVENAERDEKDSFDFSSKYASSMGDSIPFYHVSWGFPQDSQDRKLCSLSVTHFNHLRCLTTSGDSMDVEFKREATRTYSEEIKELLSSASSDTNIRAKNGQDDQNLESKQLFGMYETFWYLIEIVYLKGRNKNLPDILSKWMNDYGACLFQDGISISEKVNDILGQKITLIGNVEDNSLYWDALLSSVAIGRIEDAIRLLGLHSSAMDNQETHNTHVLVSSIFVILNEILLAQKIENDEIIEYQHQEYTYLYMKDWMSFKRKLGIFKEDLGMWGACEHAATSIHLRRLVDVIMGKKQEVNALTHNWLEFFIAFVLFKRNNPMTLSNLTSEFRKCKNEFESRRRRQMESDNSQSQNQSQSHILFEDLIISVFERNTENILMECARNMNPWFTAHVLEVLNCPDSEFDESILDNSVDSFGNLTFFEIFRLQYVNSLLSNPATWQLSTSYLSTCPNQFFLFFCEILYQKSNHALGKYSFKISDICLTNHLESFHPLLCQIIAVNHCEKNEILNSIFWFLHSKDDTKMGFLISDVLERIKRKETVELENINSMLSTMNISNSSFFPIFHILEQIQKFKIFMKNLKSNKFSNEEIKKEITEILNVFSAFVSSPYFDSEIFSEIMHNLTTLLDLPNCKQGLLTKDEILHVLMSLQTHFFHNLPFLQFNIPPSPSPFPSPPSSSSPSHLNLASHPPPKWNKSLVHSLARSIISTK